jgi:hypothetical protein
MLMIAVLVRRNMMKYRGHEFSYDFESGEVEGAEVEQPAAKKDYRRNRANTAKRKRVSRSAANHPGCGIGARRNNRWTW